MYHPSPLEEAYGMYLLETVFEVNVATTPINMRISGRNAVPFLSQSQVHRDVLRNIWSTVDPETTGSLINPYQFYAVLRMVALAQNGLGADLETLNLNHVGMPLAVFQGHSIPDELTLQNFYYQRKQGIMGAPPSVPNPQYQQQPEQPAIPNDTISAPQLQASAPSAENVVQADVPALESLVSIEDAFGGLVEVEDALLPSLDSFAPPPAPLDEGPPVPSFESIVQPTVSMDSGTDLSNVASVAGSIATRQLEGTVLNLTNSAELLSGNEIPNNIAPVLHPDLATGIENDEDDEDFGNFSSAQPSGPELLVDPLSDPQSLATSSSLLPSDPGISSMTGSDTMHGASISVGSSFPPPALSSGNWDALDSLVDVADAPLPSLPPPTFADPPTVDSNHLLGEGPNDLEGDNDSFGDFVEVAPGETNTDEDGFVDAALENNKEADSLAVIPSSIVDDSQDESFGEFDVAQADVNQEVGDDEPITTTEQKQDDSALDRLRSESQEAIVANEVVGEEQEEIESPNEELALDDAWGAFDALGTIEDAPLPALQPISHADVAEILPEDTTDDPASGDLVLGDFGENAETVCNVHDPLPCPKVGEPSPSESSGFGDFQQEVPLGNVDPSQPREFGGVQDEFGAFDAFQEPAGQSEPADLLDGFEGFQGPAGDSASGISQGASPPAISIPEKETDGFCEFEDPHARSTFPPIESSGVNTVEQSESDGFGDFQVGNNEPFADLRGPPIDSTIETSKSAPFDAFDDKLKGEGDEQSGFGEFQDPPPVSGYVEPSESSEFGEFQATNATEFNDFHGPAGGENFGGQGVDVNNFQPTIAAIPPSTEEVRSADPSPLDRVDSSYYSAEQYLRKTSSNDSEDFGAFDDAVQTEESEPRKLDTNVNNDVVPVCAVAEDFDVRRDKYISHFQGLPACILGTQAQGIVSEFGAVFYDEFTRKKTSNPEAFEIQRSLHLMELLSAQRTNAAVSSWKEALAVVGEEVRRLLSTLKAASEFSVQELAVVERRLGAYILEIAEMLRVTRNITATLGDVLLLDPSTVLSAETLKSSWGSLELAHLSLALEKDWEQVEELAVDLGFVSTDQMQGYQSLVTIRSNGVTGEHSLSQERCHCTFQPLPSPHATDLTTTTVQWQGRPFMACAANFLANRLGLVSV